MALESEDKGVGSRGLAPFVFMAKKIAITIYFDDKTGEIEEIDCTKRFEEEGPLFRMDVIKDTISALENIYQYERSRFFTEFNDVGEA